MTRLVFIGGGVAAASAIRELRSGGFEGQIVLVTDEPDLPYERPPLSKEWLSGAFEHLHFRINPDDWYAQSGVEVLLSTRAVRIDPAAHTVTLTGDRTLSYDTLVLATGVRARTLPGFAGAHVHVLRTLADAGRLRDRLRPGKHLVVLGAGFAGCEVAAFAAAHGLRVSVFDPAPLPLGRVVIPEIGSMLRDVHREHGVEMRTGEAIASMRETESGIELVTGTGELVHCDDLLVAVGSVPNVELAQEAGLAVEGGIVTDAYGRTSAPDIYAIGDVAARFHPVHDRRFRVEHHDTAMRHGINLAHNLLGRDEPFAEEHFFWSHQFDHNLQSVGHAGEGAEQVLRGSIDSRSFSLFTLSNGRVTSILAMDRPRDVMQARKLMGMPHQVTAQQLADDSFDLKSLMPRPAPRIREAAK